MKKKFAILATAILALALTGCGSAKKPVDGFMQAAQNYDFEAMQTFVKSENEAVKEDVEKNSSQAYIDDYWSKQASTITYEITETVKTGNTATVKVTVNYSDGSKIIEETISDYMQQGMKLAMSEDETTDEQYSEMFKSLFLLKCASMPPENATANIEFTCEKIDGNWMITKLPEEMKDIITCNMIKSLSQ